MYNESRNPQVLFSLEAMTKGLFTCLQNKRYEQVSVSEICAQAGISRRTFYRDCEGKEDLILFACHTLIRRLLESVDFQSTDALNLYRNFFSFWQEHSLFLASVRRNGFSDMFARSFIGICNREMRFPIQENAVKDHPEPEKIRAFSNSFILGGLVQMLLSWADDEFRSPAEDLVFSILYLVPSVGP